MPARLIPLGGGGSTSPFLSQAGRWLNELDDDWRTTFLVERRTARELARMGGVRDLPGEDPPVDPWFRTGRWVLLSRQQWRNLLEYAVGRLIDN